MQSYNQVLTILNTIATANKFINTFSSGSLDQMDLEKITLFPLMHVVLTGAIQDAQEMTYSIDLYIADTILEDETNEDEVLSNTLQTMSDVIAQFRMGGVDNSNVTPSIDYRINLPVNCEPFLDRFENMITGWQATLDIVTPNPLNACIAPVS